MVTKTTKKTKPKKQRKKDKQPKANSGYNNRRSNEQGSNSTNFHRDQSSKTDNIFHIFKFNTSSILILSIVVFLLMIVSGFILFDKHYLDRKFIMELVPEVAQTLQYIFELNFFRRTTVKLRKLFLIIKFCRSHS